LATLAARLAAAADLDARVALWTRERAPEDAAALLQAAGVSALPVLGPDELRADPHLLARDAIVQVEHPEIGAERHIANPIRLSHTRLRTAGAAPLLGADTHDVLMGVLGLGPAEAQQLIDNGICA
jgi:crotonobetainyl-CoA:carnitine CoA-transferase CaiB-like acyl-CoA transferase